MSALGFPRPEYASGGFSSESGLEMWGGVECTVNRVRGRYMDQVVSTGHQERESDLDLFASLGITALRYPVLWERTAPKGLERADWSWPDRRLGKLRELGIRPIVTLVHHGNGPRGTNLLDPDFPAKLAAYAAAVARRYPWVQDWTPINEPLTTARFSALYGLWYPHAADPLLFGRALLNQCRAIALAMKAIREVRPDARLVQTEDLGKTHSTPRLRYQATFENNRRWLSFDLLTGRVNKHHPLWDYLMSIGLTEADLMIFAEEPCPPDIMGLNYYLTSERYLDEHIDKYPGASVEGNGRDIYADVEMVRASRKGFSGAQTLLREVWTRYGLPMAVTEAHNACTREEQMRWFLEVWRAAAELRAEGADMRAVTAWALLGAYDWNTLLTRSDGHYESGVFDTRSPLPRPTALAPMLRALSSGKSIEDAVPRPVLDNPGWWRRSKHRLYGDIHDPEVHSALHPSLRGSLPGTFSILITGARGTLGGAFARKCDLRGLSYKLLTRLDMDISDPESVRAALQQYKPWAVVNAAGYVRVDDAEREPEICMRENASGPRVLAKECAAAGVGLLTFSSDLVFDGLKASPYIESDPVAPLNVYGRSKAQAERWVLDALPDALVVRTSAFFGPWDPYNFASNVLDILERGEKFRAATDMVVSPTYVPDLVHTSLDLLLDGESGIWHLTNGRAVSWYDFACAVARARGFSTSLIEGEPQREGLAALRPAYSALGSERAWLMPPLESALARYMHERVPQPQLALSLIR